MPLQYVSQVAQMRDTWVFACQAAKIEAKAPTHCLELFEQAVNSFDRFLTDACSKLDIVITPVELPPPEHLELPPQLTKTALVCSQLSSDAELPDSLKEILNESRDALRQEKKQLVLYAESLILQSDTEKSGAAIHLALYDKIFAPSSQFSPVHQILLLQAVCDEIFGYGPMGPFIRVFPEMQMQEDGSFRALTQAVGPNKIVPVDKPLQVEFDDDLHKDEVFALFKFTCKSVAEDGYVEFSNPGNWKLRMPAKVADALDTKESRMEKIGLMTIRKEEPSTMWQKLGDWLATKIRRIQTPTH